jgi:NAD(P)H-dependent FMN reductase
MTKNRLTVVGLGGSLAQRSNSLACAKNCLRRSGRSRRDNRTLDIKQLSLPMYAPANDNPPYSVRRLCDAIHNAEGLIWSSPMYNGTISGSINNPLDWLKLLGDRNPRT